MSTVTRQDLIDRDLAAKHNCAHCLYYQQIGSECLYSADGIPVKPYDVCEYYSKFNMKA